ncbi:phage tail protein [Spirosoma sp. KCTC 42546]|uniref:phage tail protein n=1 Tax=Spirosoma sp. KCTC 42546 TaxID=2520506 RepID=UPI0011582E57|nr:phage tail protein [Spirosoma sp. KCTC 42546]QDK82117.1 phage tail protein [Spirosoma sp. KCTC 42546]
MAGLLYPPVGFHFLVAFELFPQTIQDGRFQEISGLNVEMQMESIREGGENRFEHQLPVRTKYSDLVLKRGLFVGSGVYQWAKNAFEDFQFQPVNLLISLLNEQHAPLMSWHVVHALPKKWDISAFNAEQNTIAIETLTLTYRYYTTIRI